MANLQNQLALPHSIFETPFPAKVSKGTHYLASTMHRFHSKAITMNAIRHIDPITQEIKKEFGKVMGGETSVFHAIDNWLTNALNRKDTTNRTRLSLTKRARPNPFATEPTASRICGLGKKHKIVTWNAPETEEQHYGEIMRIERDEGTTTHRLHHYVELTGNDYEGNNEYTFAIEHQNRTFIVECNGMTCTQGYLQNGKCIIYKQDGFMNIWSNKDQSNKLYEPADMTNKQPAEDPQQYTSRQIIECKTIVSVQDSIPRETNDLQTKHESPLGVTEEEKTTGRNRAAIYFEGPQELITAIGALKARECNTRDAIYSDGSLTFTNGKPSLAGSVVAWDSTQKGRRINFGIEGNASSTNAEMYATNAALLGVNGPTDMYIDNMAVIQTFKRLERSKFNIKRRELFTLSNVYTAAQMCHIAKSIARPLPILHHVKSHTGVSGNELADSDANDGHMAPLLKMKLEGQSLIQFTLCTNNIMLEGNYRETLTMINKAKTFLAWIEQPAHKHIAEVQNSINFGLTFALLQRGHKQTSYFTSEAHSHYRKWDINAMHRLLPVQSEMRRRHQDAYPNGTCRVCHQEEETNDHLWCCIETEAIRMEIWEEMITLLVKQTEPPKKRKRNENTVDSQSNKANETKIRLWLKNWDGQTRDNRPPQPRDEIGIEADKMTFTHIAGYGFIPNVMYRILEKCGIRKPQTQRMVILTTWKELKMMVKERIWKPRCDKTTAWEETNQITATIKARQSNTRQKHEGPRNKPKEGKRKHKTTEIKEGTRCQHCMEPLSTDKPHKHGRSYGQQIRAIDMISSDNMGIRKIPPGIINTLATYMDQYAREEEFCYNPDTIAKDSETDQQDAEDWEGANLWWDTDNTDISENNETRHYTQEEGIEEQHQPPPKRIREELTSGPSLSSHE
ncbi:hypothetical protein BCR33DRAFT_745941 [Rhizoclosmatium globosum]|uniref:RNase H type-1 domain-containing protein n=1 Tax=Rhizoclosmatium globosum TaxID=329046 RepID=A0A1Y2AZQ8_9FUNG|nr:hypothetical protein BCR33DRAFT_745941 [Rhizoclosmatium globosum]|eukprot:ORY27727.1 hypothetical protein BCR33DRAFT_745941 [Rhizoclosmatium globosum]